MSIIERLDLLSGWYRAAARAAVRPPDAPSTEHQRYRMLRTAANRLDYAGDMLTAGNVSTLYCAELADDYDDLLVKFAVEGLSV